MTTRSKDSGVTLVQKTTETGTRYFAVYFGQRFKYTISDSRAPLLTDSESAWLSEVGQ